MSLIEEVKKVQEESYDKWFERWYRKANLESKIVEAAQQGCTSYYISIINERETEARFNERRRYITRRARDERTTKNIQEKLGTGFVVRLKKEIRTTRVILDMTMSAKKEFISINWGDE